MKKVKQGRANGRQPSRDSQIKTPASKPGSRTIRVYFPADIVPLIDRTAAMEGGSREEFILNAVQEKIDREATVKTIWISLPDRLIAILDSVCEKEGESRQEMFERIIREHLPTTGHRAGQGTATVKGGAR
jgi:metal-responsive CopG/Arc/MetJ family transcriptional regulator